MMSCSYFVPIMHEACQLLPGRPLSSLSGAQLVNFGPCCPELMYRQPHDLCTITFEGSLSQLSLVVNAKSCVNGFLWDRIASACKDTG